jgi:hypothetical protein
VLKQFFDSSRSSAGSKDDEALLFEILINTKETISFVYDEKVQILISPKAVGTQKEKALINRIAQFRYKYLVIYLLVDILKQLGEHILLGIINCVRTKKIQVEFTRHERYDRVTPTSAIHL